MGALFSSDVTIKVQPIKLPGKVLKGVPKVDARTMSSKKAVPKLRGALLDATKKIDVLQPASTTLQQQIETLTRKKQMVNKVLEEASVSRNRYSSNIEALAKLSGGAGSEALGTLLKKL